MTPTDLISFSPSVYYTIKKIRWRYKKYKNPQQNSDICDSANQRLGGLGHQLRQPSEYSIGSIGETDETLRQIDRNRVHADHGKKQSPFTPPQYIYDIEEQSKHPNGISTYHTDKGTCP